MGIATSTDKEVIKVMSDIMIWFLLILILLPKTEVIISNKYFSWNYSRDRLIKRHKQFIGRLFKIK